MRITAEMVNGHAHRARRLRLPARRHGVRVRLQHLRRGDRGPAADIAFVAPCTTGDELVAVAEERTRSGRSGVYDVTVRRSGDEVVAEFRGHSRGLGRPLGD